MTPVEQNFFYSNLFIAIVTFIVGSFGLYLYHRRKRDGKRRVAKIILLEIENAEAQLKDAKKQVLANPDDPLPEHLYTMPTNSWSKNKHLFVEDFKSTEWNAINQFYDCCELFDEAIRHNDARFAEQEKEVRRNVHWATYKYAIEFGEKLLDAKTDEENEEIIQEFFKKRNSAVGMLTNGRFIYIYTPTKQNNVVKSCLDNADTSLSLNVVGQRLKSLSKSRIFW